jgi:hypothetical protein
MGRAHSAAARTAEQEPAEEALTEGLNVTLGEAVEGARAELAALGERAGLAAAREALRARREEAGGDGDEAAGPFAWLRRQREEDPASDEPETTAAETTAAETTSGGATPATATTSDELATSGEEGPATAATTTAATTTDETTSDATSSAPAAAYAAPPPATSAEATTPSATTTPAALTPEPGAAALAAETPAPVMGLLTGIKDGAVDELVGVRDFVVGLYHHTNPLAWETYKATWANTFQTAVTLFQQPELLLTALVEPYKAAYAEGGGFQAAGRLFWDVATLWSAPTKALRGLKITSRVGELAKAASAAGKAGQAAGMIAGMARLYSELSRLRRRHDATLAQTLAVVQTEKGSAAATRSLRAAEDAIAEGLLTPDDPNLARLMDDLAQHRMERYYLGPFAEIARYVQLVRKGDIAPGTAVGMGVKAGDEVKGLPDVGIKDLEIDAYYMTKAGLLVAEEVKATPRAFVRKMDARLKLRAEQAPDWEKTMKQPGRYGEWAQAGADGPPREVRYYIQSDEPFFGEMLNSEMLKELLGKLPASTPFEIGGHSMTLGDLLHLASRKEAILHAQHKLPELSGMTKPDINHQLLDNVEMTLKNLTRLEEALAHAS